MRILAICSYNGKNYQGWQKQPNAPTVQEEIEKQLSKYFNRPISIQGAGRTDAGVHALGQRFHFDIDEESLDLDRLLYSINLMLPEDIKIVDLEEVEPDFHARFSAKGKIYCYNVLLESKDVLFGHIFYLFPYDMDADKLNEALTHFVGKHNFKNFTSKETDEDNFVRTINDIDMQVNGKEITITFDGDGFMRYMIRYIVGTALEYARGRLTAHEIDDLLDENSERNIVSWKAPASGLMLVDVKY